jgi:serine/threonine protein kinase
MTPERWERIKPILATAIELAPAARKEYVRQAAGDDRALCDDLLSLLAADSTTTLLHNPILAPETRFGTYRLLEPIGEGGMGVVYRAYDETRKRLVALKTLQGMTAAALFRFKNEFRSFADLTHPNLVTLYELLSDGHRWCFTMELVDGAPFGHGRLRGPEPATRHADVERIRDAFTQLAAGLAALHAADKLHRDIKPTNVLVTAAGRVVLLDFGLGVNLDSTGIYQTLDARVLGTVAYMSPEQAAGRAMSPASDWYSVGVMLYQELTGRLPFDGTAMDICNAKRFGVPEPPAALAPQTPDDLNSLCVELLRHDPAGRPRGPEVMRRLGGRHERRGHGSTACHASAQLFVGRAAELAVLRHAYDTMRSGTSVITHIHGQSGAGKSALLHRFLDSIAADPDVVILTGRCFEQESVPFNALDSLVDSLARHLRRLTPLEAHAIMPRDVRALARVFPVLWQVEAIAEAPVVGGTVPDLQELRRRAAAALRELLARLGDRRRLVLAIDDLQWGDVDSATLLTDMLMPPDSPLVLALLAYRSEDAAASPFVRHLRHVRAPGRSWQEEREIAVDRLAPEDTRDLAARLLPESGGRELLEAIVDESAGRPFLVYELVEHVKSSADASVRLSLTLEEALWRRVERLPEETRRLLEIVAIAGRPIRTLDACRAAGVTSDDRTVLPGLRAARLIRGTTIGSNESIEAYHDRVRECVLGRLDPATRREHHRRLAQTFAASATVDGEALALHLERAGETGHAAEYYARAASASAEALAFDHAAALYDRALELKSWNHAERCALRTRMADALSCAGRGGDAARTYLVAAADADPKLRLELQRRAALQLLTSGHVDEGLSCLRPVLTSVGTRLAGTPWRALLSLLVRRAQLRVRGVGFTERAEQAIDRDELQRIDVGWSAVVGLSVIDPIRGADFQTRSLLLALRAGEPFRVARALAVEAAHLASSGSIRRATFILDQAERLATRIQHPYALGIVVMARGAVAYLTERWKDALRFSDEAAATFREHCTAATWEIDTATAFSMWSRSKMGHVAELTRLSPVLLKEAHERGDLYAIANLSNHILALVRLSADDPERARAELHTVMTRWSQNGYHVQHQDALLAFVTVELYLGNPEGAWGRMQSEWSAFRWSLLNHVRVPRLEMIQMRAYCALAMAAVSPAPERFLTLAAKDAGRLRRDGMPWTRALARYIDGTIAVQRGDFSYGTRALAEAVSLFDHIDAALQAAATRHQLGTLVGGTAGAEYLEAAAGWFDSHGVANAERMAATYAPGLECVR